MIPKKACRRRSKASGLLRWVCRECKLKKRAALAGGIQTHAGIGTPSTVSETMHWHTKHCIRDDAHSQAEGTAANLSRRDSLCSGDFTGGGCL